MSIPSVRTVNTTKYSGCLLEKQLICKLKERNLLPESCIHLSFLKWVTRGVEGNQAVTNWPAEMLSIFRE